MGYGELLLAIVEYAALRMASCRQSGRLPALFAFIDLTPQSSLRVGSPLDELGIVGGASTTGRVKEARTCGTNMRGGGNPPVKTARKVL